MSNSFILGPNGPDVLMTVNGKSVTIPRGCLDDLRMIPTISPFKQKLRDISLGAPEEMKALNEFLNTSNPELLHNMMDEIKKL